MTLSKCIGFSTDDTDLGKSTVVNCGFRSASYRKRKQASSKRQSRTAARSMLHRDATSIELSAISRAVGAHSGFQCSTAELQGMGPLSSTIDYPQCSTPQGIKSKAKRRTTSRRELPGRRLQSVGKEKSSSPGGEECRVSKAIKCSESNKLQMKHKSKLLAVGCLPVSLKTTAQKRVVRRSPGYKQDKTYVQSVCADVQSWVQNCTTWSSIELNDCSQATVCVRGQNTFERFEKPGTCEQETCNSRDITPVFREVQADRSDDIKGARKLSSETFVVETTNEMSVRPPCDGKEATPRKSRHVHSSMQADGSSLKLSASKSSCRRDNDTENSNSMTYVTRLDASEWPTLAVF